MAPVIAALRRVRLRLAAAFGFALAGASVAGPPPGPPAEPPPSLAQCAGVRDLAFVAHLDDDLLFMNPDIAANIEAGGCVRVVYLTASERGEGDGYMLGRERGVRAAYASMAHQPDDWREDTVMVGSRHLARFTLAGNPRVQLWHMRLKDPWLGTGWGSLTPLSQAESVAGTTAETLGPYADTYDRPALVDTIARIIGGYAPTTVRHLDDTISVPYTKLCWRCAGHGHPDHIASARLVRDAMALAPGNYAQVGYVDYPSQEHETNLAAAEIASKSEIFRRYAWNDYRYCAGPQNCQEPAGPAAAWVQRAYYVSRPEVAPELQADARLGLMLFATGEANDAVNLWNDRSRRWSTLGGRTAGQLSSFSYPDATAGVFARDSLGGLWVNKQHPDGTLNGWQTMAGPRFSREPTIAGQGAAAAVALANDGRYYWSVPQGLAGGWAAWQALPDLPGATGAAALVTDAKGRLAVFAADGGGRIHATTQAAGGDSPWLPWRAVPAPAARGGLAAIRNARGAIELYLRDARSGHLMRLAQDDGAVAAGQDATAARWGAAADLGLPYIGRPAVAASAAGRVAVAIQESPAGALWLLEDGKATRLAEHAASLPTLRFVSDTLYVVARGTGPEQSYRILARRHGVWSSTASTAELPRGGGGPFAVASALAAPAPAAPTLAAMH